MKGTMEIIALCRDCVSLKATVFVSTAYSNCIYEEVKEEFYDPPMAVDDLLALLDRLTASELDLLCPKILGAWPNPYVFSKAMAENVVLTRCKGVPVSVVRPSMVLSAFKEPTPGWLDNVYGPIGIALGVGSGILRVAFAEADYVIDTIPVDIVTNAVIASTLSSSKRADDRISIYNVATSDNDAPTLGEMTEFLIDIAVRDPMRICLWYPFIIYVNSHKLYKLLAFFLHFLPGLLLDCALRLAGRPPMLLKIYRKIQMYTVLTVAFAVNFVFITENTRKLYAELDIKDKEIFFFDPKMITWPEFLRSTNNIRKYVFNGILDPKEGAQPHLRPHYIAHTVTKYLLSGFAIWAVWCFVKFCKQKFLT
ncbi:fatty acyl-CoA reductase wat-like isoform X2 [Bacillus rossius redtenbacheri]